MPSLHMLSELIPAFVTLFVIIDPVGLIPVFIVLTQDTSGAFRRRMAIRACITSFLILTVFGMVGQNLLGAFGIEMPAFRIAGGTLLFLVALEMLFERRSHKRNRRAEKVHQELGDSHPPKDPSSSETSGMTPSAKPIATPQKPEIISSVQDEPDDISVFPLAIPFLSGPGSIATIMLLMGKHQGNLVMQAGLITVVALVLLCAFGFFLASSIIAKHLSPTVSIVISRLLGMILAALAIQFIIDGIKQAFF